MTGRTAPCGPAAALADADSELRALRAAFALNLSLRDAAANGPRYGQSASDSLKLVSSAAQGAEQLERRIEARLAGIWCTFYNDQVRRPHQGIVDLYAAGLVLALQAAAAERHLLAAALADFGLLAPAPGALLQMRAFSAETALQTFEAARSAGLSVPSECEAALAALKT
jgi:hypothetical protein